MRTCIIPLHAPQHEPFSSAFPARLHISAEDIAAFVSTNVSANERKYMVSHLADCKDCRTLAAEVTLSRVAVQDTA